MSDAERKNKIEYMKPYCYRRKKLYNHLTNCIEELENFLSF